ncbi:MAG TPA: hypothetical protein DDW27_08505 [Bacteroidales bacterium]|nr:hypothetical protein [Bacteroidales bacterium]
MKTLKEELQGCLSEMQSTAKKFEELMNTPGITWPELEEPQPERLGKIIGCSFWHQFPIGATVNVLYQTGNKYECSCPGFDYTQTISGTDIIIYTREK